MVTIMQYFLECFNFSYTPRWYGLTNTDRLKAKIYHMRDLFCYADYDKETYLNLDNDTLDNIYYLMAELKQILDLNSEKDIES